MIVFYLNCTFFCSMLYKSKEFIKFAENTRNRFLKRISINYF